MNDDYKYIMELLESVPLVKEHIEKETTKLSREIVRKRMRLDLSRSDLAKLTSENGYPITQQEIMNVESEWDDIPLERYTSLLASLGKIEGENEQTATSSFT